MTTMKWKDKKVGVLFGGLSSEREVSLKSGKAVSGALVKKGYDVVEIDMGHDVAQKLLETGVEVVFIALHGKYGEDGVVQGLLEIMRIPYTGSSPQASAMSFDKIVTKNIIAPEGIRTPRWKRVYAAETEFMTTAPVAFPVIIKPSREGSTIGMSIVREEGELRAGLLEAARYGDELLVEEFIVGTEVTVGILDGEVLPILEVVPKSGFYDYKSKYTKGMTDYILPARISRETEKIVLEQSKRIFRVLGLSGVARADYIISQSGEPCFLEINTIPGMTETSLVPKMAAYQGVDFETLCEKILGGASLKLTHT